MPKSGSCLIMRLPDSAVADKTGLEPGLPGGAFHFFGQLLSAKQDFKISGCSIENRSLKI